MITQEQPHRLSRHDEMTATLAKPRYGAACNGCGGCCIATLCPLGEMIFEQDDGPCPALEPADDHAASGRYVCGLVAHPQRYAPLRTAVIGSVERMRQGALLLIGAGQGCDAQVKNEADNPDFRRHLRTLAQRQRASGKIARACRDWGVAPL